MSTVRFAIVLPAGPDVQSLTATVLSLRAQTYPHWRLHMGGDRLGPAEKKAIAELAGGEDRLSWISGNAIVAPRKDGLYILPLVAGDELTPDALAQFALLIGGGDAPPHMVYGDHAERFGRGAALTPYFKPAWSPETLIATNYVGRAALMSERLEPGSLRSDYDALDLWALWLAQSRDPGLRVERDERVVMSVADLPTDDARIGERAVGLAAAHLAGLGVNGSPVWPDWARAQGILALDVDFPDAGPTVSVLIPTREDGPILRRCLESLTKTTYRNFDVVIIDTSSSGLALTNLPAGLDARRIHVPSGPAGFSFSGANNKAAAQATGAFLLFLNDDTEVIMPCWLSQMVGWGQVRGVASVGARLLFPDGRIQHAGLVQGLLEGVLPAPAFKLMGTRAKSPHAQDRLVRNYSAMTAACLLTRRDFFLAEGGFNDTDYSVAYNDCDYGFRLTRRGMRHVFVPSAELFHHEGVTRGRGKGNDKIGEEVAFIRQYMNWDDPNYNRNLSRDSFMFEPARRAVIETGLDISGLSVALFTHNLNYEGAPLVLADIARGLKRLSGGAVVVVSPLDGPLKAVLEDAGCSVVVRTDLAMFHQQAEQDLHRALMPVVAELRSAGVDVVIANTVLCHWGLVAGRLAGLPGLWIIHESEPPFSHLDVHGAMHVELAKRCFEESYMNIFVAEATRDLYRPFHRSGNLAVVYNGLDPDSIATAVARYDRAAERRKLGAKDDDVVFVLPGVVSQRKSQLDLLRAIENLPDAISNRAVFVIVGDRESAYSKDLHQRAAGLVPARRARLRIVRETPDIWRYYAAADAMILTSRLESFPRVIQEGMACGLAILSTPVFGISEQLRDEQSGLFFNVGDVAGLAHGIARLVKDPALRTSLGDAARLSLGRFPTLDEMQEKYWNLVREAFLSGTSAEASMPGGWLSDTSTPSEDWWNRLIGL